MLRITVGALAALLLAGCGETSAPPTAPAAPAAERSEAETAVVLAALPAPYNAADLANGERVFARCRSCHTVTEGGPNRVGPNLWNIFGREAGSHPDYRYSEAVEAADFVWDAERLDHWLENPRDFLPGNKMSFAGVRDADDRRDLIAWLKVQTGYEG